jgi:hypothetical protein
MSRLAVVATAALLLAAPASASAGEDASHGRFDGDLGIASAAGVTVGPRGPRATADVRFRYLSSAGVFVTYEEGPLIGSRAEPRRALAFGLEIRPLFLGRWGRGLETAHPRFDLLVDSLALELGAAFLEPEGRPFGARPALQLGLGLELPIFPRATGPFVGLHGGVRFSDDALSGLPLAGPADRALYLSIVLGWQQLFGGHVASLGDPPARSR